MASIGYARVSTLDQNADLQHAALKAAGCKRIFTDHGVSGTRAGRPELDKLLEHLRDGDEVVVWKLDRLGRNTRNLLALIDDLEGRGVHFRSVTEGISTTGAMGKAMLTVHSPNWNVTSWPNVPRQAWPQPLPTIGGQDAAKSAQGTATSNAPMN
jgi:DNA invertase Pin-like site-specific DNA recombinase